MSQKANKFTWFSDSGAGLQSPVRRSEAPWLCCLWPQHQEHKSDASPLHLPPRVSLCHLLANTGQKSAGKEHANLQSHSLSVRKQSMEINTWIKAKRKAKSLSRVRLFPTPWAVAYQAPPSMELSKQECWSGLPFPSPEDLPDSGIEPRSPVLHADSLPWKPVHNWSRVADQDTHVLSHSQDSLNGHCFWFWHLWIVNLRNKLFELLLPHKAILLNSTSCQAFLISGSIILWTSFAIK